MGTVLAQLNQLPEARLHLLIAQKIGLISPSNQNLELVEEKLEITRLEKPLSVSDYFFKTSFLAAEGWLTTLSLIFLITGIIICRKSASVKKLGLFFIATITPLIFNFIINAVPLEISLKPIVFKEGPSEIFMDRGEIPAGVMLITREREGWREILFPSRFNGWVKDNPNLKRL